MTVMKVMLERMMVCTPQLGKLLQQTAGNFHTIIIAASSDTMLVMSPVVVT